MIAGLHKTGKRKRRKRNTKRRRKDQIADKKDQAQHSGKSPGSTRRKTKRTKNKRIIKDRRDRKASHAVAVEKKKLGLLLFLKSLKLNRQSLSRAKK